jgi:hypothetical protein
MVLVAVGVVAVLAPGLGDVRQRLEGVQPGWPGVAIVLEMLSCLSYVLMFRPIFYVRMSLRTSYRLGISSVATTRRPSGARRGEPPSAICSATSRTFTGLFATPDLRALCHD